MESIKGVTEECQGDVNLKKYLLRFFLIHIALMVLLGFVSSVLNIDFGSGMSVVILMCSAMYTVGAFIQDNKRAPNQSEKNKLVWYSFFILLGLSMIIGASLLLPLIAHVGLTSLLDDIGTLIFSSLFFLFLIAIQIILLYLCYGWLANKQYNAMKEKGKL